MKHTLTIIILIFSSNAFGQKVEFLNYDGFYSIGTQSNRTASISLVDIDNDGDLDALVANGRHWAEQNYLYYNNGNGAFKKAQPIGKFMDASYSIKSADLNNDGFMDIAVVNDKSENKIYFGFSKKSFKIGTTSTFGNPLSASRNLEIADIDNDEDFDLIISNRKSLNEICLNDGNGNFDTIITFGKKTDQTLQTKIIDINKDGFLDLITAERQSKNKIYLNDGELNFYRIIEFGDKEDTRSIDIADFNKDGFSDIIEANLGSENVIYFGNKEFTFTKTFSFKETRMTTSVKIADLNQDEILDIIEGNSEQHNYVYLGNTEGSFNEIGLRKDLKEDTYNIAIGDLNDDGLPDIVEANSGTWNLYYITRKK